MLAAASLQESFRALGDDFEARASGLRPARVLFSFAGSQTLAAQVRAGVRADVIASADPRTLAPLVRARLISSPTRIGTNRLVWVFGAESAGRVPGSPEDPLDAGFLAHGDWRLVLAAAEVPAGRYARSALRALGALETARSHLVSHELDVRGVLGKVRSGDADMGLVYATDVPAALRDALLVRELPAAGQVRAEYAIATLQSSTEPELALAFARFVASADGRKLLRGFGFGPP